MAATVFALFLSDTITGDIPKLWAANSVINMKTSALLTMCLFLMYVVYALTCHLKAYQQFN
jgi:hypothetical protein